MAKIVLIINGTEYKLEDIGTANVINKTPKLVFEGRFYVGEAVPNFVFSSIPSMAEHLAIARAQNNL